MNSTDTILEEVREIAADVLALDVEEVQPSDSFYSKLDGDSLGFLELGFQCEKRYGIKFQFQKMFPEDRLLTDDAGRLTPDSLALLKQELPFLDYSRIEANPLRNRLGELLTIDAIAHLVRRTLAAAQPRMNMPKP